MIADATTTPSAPASHTSTACCGVEMPMPMITGTSVTAFNRLAIAVAVSARVARSPVMPSSDTPYTKPRLRAQIRSSRALARGATPADVLTELKTVDAGVPLVAMTYYNLVFHPGEARFARWLAEAGVSGAIVPDVPLEEVGPWAAAADAEGVATVLLAAPTADDARLERICARSRGFVYGVSLLGITGERTSLAGTATAIAKRLKAVTDVPVIIGIGISTPEQAVEVCEAGADGVVVASAIMRRLLAGEPPEAAGDAVAKLRAALDAG